MEQGEEGKGERWNKGEAAWLCLAISTKALLLYPDRAPRVVRFGKVYGLLTPPSVPSPQQQPRRGHCHGSLGPSLPFRASGFLPSPEGSPQVCLHLILHLITVPQVQANSEAGIQAPRLVLLKS